MTISGTEELFPPSNAARAEMARHALEQFFLRPGTFDSDEIGKLITALLHYAAQVGLTGSVSEVLARALLAYDEQARAEDVSFDAKIYAFNVSGGELISAVLTLADRAERTDAIHTLLYGLLGFHESRD